MAHFNAYHSNLRMNGRCPICNTMYDLQKFKILAEREQNVLTYIQCSHCGSAILSVLSMQPQGLQAVGLVTDLTSDEVVNFESGEHNVSVDDVVDMHEALDKDQNIIPQ